MSLASPETIAWEFQNLEDFHVDVNNGDVINGHVKSDDSISIHIMSEDDFESFDPDSEDNEVYWKSPRTTGYNFSWTSKDEETVVIAIVDEYEVDDEEEEEEATATARIDVIRKGVSD